MYILQLHILVRTTRQRELWVIIIFAYFSDLFYIYITCHNNIRKSMYIKHNNITINYNIIVIAFDACAFAYNVYSIYAKHSVECASHASDTTDTHIKCQLRFQKNTPLYDNNNITIIIVVHVIIRHNIIIQLVYETTLHRDPRICV